MQLIIDEESGQGMVEYGLILALVAVVAIVAFQALGNATKNKAGYVAKAIDSGEAAKAGVN